jgi:hypothetical protein
VPSAISLAIARTAACVPAGFFGDEAGILEATTAGEVEPWVVGETTYLTLTPLGAERCGVRLDEYLNVPESASVPTWVPADMAMPPIRKIESTHDIRAASWLIETTPEPWRSILDLTGAGHELRQATHERAKPMPEKRTTTKPKRRKSKRRLRIAAP